MFLFLFIHQRTYQKLTKAFTVFSETMRAQYEEGDQTKATKSDIHNVAREAFYTMYEMKKQIIAYLKENALTISIKAIELAFKAVCTR